MKKKMFKVFIILGMNVLLASPALLAAQRAEVNSINGLLPMDIQLEKTNGGSVTMSELMKDKKGVLIDFWATWCGPCMSFMPELAHKGENLIPQGIAVVGMNIDNKAKAETVRNVHGINFDWLVEPAGVPYSQFFSINSIPRVVLLDSNAKVLYNGHPNGPELKKALKSLGVNL